MLLLSNEDRQHHIILQKYGVHKKWIVQLILSVNADSVSGTDKKQGQSHEQAQSLMQ